MKILFSTLDEKLYGIHLLYILCSPVLEPLFHILVGFYNQSDKDSQRIVRIPTCHSVDDGNDQLSKRNRMIVFFELRYTINY